MLKIDCDIGKLFCHCRWLAINNKAADESDFGFFHDTGRELVEPAEGTPPLGCVDMQFIPFTVPEETLLVKYNITVEEFNTIGNYLKERLSFGRCTHCTNKARRQQEYEVINEH